MTNEERETHFNIAADNRGECEVFTDDPVWRGRLEKWFAPYKVQGEGAWFRVPTNAVIREATLVAGSSALRRLSGVGGLSHTVGSEAQTAEFEA